MTDRRRLLLSVEPRLFNDTLLRLLEATGLDEVVAVAPGTEPPGHFDSAIVTDPAAQVPADLVIDLTEARRGQVGVLTPEGAEVIIDLDDLQRVIGLLDEHAPSSGSRLEALRRRGL